MVLYLLGERSNMLRVSKLSDYSMVLLSYLAKGESGESLTAREIANGAILPFPTVSKILKTLTRAGILQSQRGTKGGYALTRSPEDIAIVEIIGAMEGPIAMTECIENATGECDQVLRCPVQANWQVINQAVANALSDITLADMIRPVSATETERCGPEVQLVSIEGE